MNFPTLDLRDTLFEIEQKKLLCEQDFEKNYPQFVDQVVQKKAESTLYAFNRLKIEFIDGGRNIHMGYQNNHFVRYIDFDITNSKNLLELKQIAKKQFFLPPFSYWITDCKQTDLDNDSVDTLKDLMERAAILAEDKLNQLFQEYCAIPSHNILTYEITRDATKLNIRLKIERENTWPDLDKHSSKKNRTGMPSINMRKLGRIIHSREIKFEKNYLILADKITKSMITSSLYKLQKNFNAILLKKPSKETPIESIANFSLSDTQYDNSLIRRCCSFPRLSPFRLWILDFHQYRNNESIVKYYQGFMNRVALATEKKITENLNEFISNPQNDVMEFTTSFCETSSLLKLHVWIKEEKEEKKVGEEEILPKYESNQSYKDLRTPDISGSRLLSLVSYEQI